MHIDTGIEIKLINGKLNSIDVLKIVIKIEAKSLKANSKYYEFKRNCLVTKNLACQAFNLHRVIRVGPVALLSLYDLVQVIEALKVAHFL